MERGFKIAATIIFLSFLLWNCTEETFPSCQEDFGSINYPFKAHSHNDYKQDQPITNALQHGFSSIEVDVAYDGTQLRVSHDDKNLNDKPVFEISYLKPILDTDIGEGGLILLVDIKNYSTSLIQNLNNTLSSYESQLTSRDNSSLISGKLKIVLSGDIPRSELINNSDNTFLFIDGRLNDTDLNFPSDLVPIISLNISDISDSDANDTEAINGAINRVHTKDKMIRFWNTNDKESVWLKLIDQGVDIIGVDDIEKFCGVMKENGFIN